MHTPPQVMLRVGDLDKSIDFYTRVLGMKLIRRRDNEQYKYTLAFLGAYGGAGVGRAEVVGRFGLEQEAPCLDVPPRTPLPDQMHRRRLQGR